MKAAKILILILLIPIMPLWGVLTVLIAWCSGMRLTPRTTFSDVFRHLGCEFEDVKP